MFRELLQRECGQRNDISSHPSLIRRLQHSTSLQAHNAPVNSVAWSPDGSLLLSGSEDAVLKIWDLSRSTTKPHQSFDTGTEELLQGCIFSMLVTCLDA